nr:MAG TPA: hypothetical protein [Bacteriophage sp.]
MIRLLFKEIRGSFISFSISCTPSFSSRFIVR